MHAQSGMSREHAAEGCDVRHVAGLVVARSGAELEAQHDSPARELVPERLHLRRVERPGEAVAAERIDVEVESAKPQHVERMVDLGELPGLSRHRVVDMHQAGHPPGILPSGEGVHLGHRPVPAAGLQDAVIDAGVHHLGQHQFRRRRHVLHAHRHVLDGVVFAVMRELELPETADAEIDVGEAGPAFVSGPEQRLGVGARAVTDAEGRCDRPGDDPLQVALVDLARRDVRRRRSSA